VAIYFKGDIKVYGKVEDTGVSQIYLRVVKAIKEDRGLDRIIRRVEKEIMSNVEAGNR
jgi:hypothetical protein